MDLEDSFETEDSDWGFVTTGTETKSPEKKVKKESESSLLEATKSFWYTGKLSLMSSFYNLYQRYPTTPPMFSNDPIWALGKLYTLTEKEAKRMFHNKSHVQPPHAQRFLWDVYHSFLWFTYRRDFPLIGCYDLTTDTGWGCMLRTGQMLLAKVLLNLPAGATDWALSGPDQRNPYSHYRQVLRMFADTPMAPFSVHTLVEENNELHGAKRDASIGDTLQDELEIYVPSDGTIYLHDAIKMCTTYSEAYLSRSARSSRVETVDTDDNSLSAAEKRATKEKFVWYEQKEDFLGSVPGDTNQNNEKAANEGEVSSTIAPDGKDKQKQNNDSLSSSDFSASPVLIPASKHPLSPKETSSSNSECDLSSSTTSVTQTSKLPNTPIVSPHSPSFSLSIPYTPGPCFDPELYTPAHWSPHSKVLSGFLKKTELKQLEWKPILFLIPSRIGIDRINEAYVPHLKHLLSSRFSVGIVGGKPRASLYFIGFQEGHVIYLDPHLVQDAIPAEAPITAETLQSYHCKAPQRMNLVEIDPNFSVGIFCKTLEDFLMFVNEELEFAAEGSLTVFTISEMCPDYVQSCFDRRNKRRNRPQKVK